MDGCPLGLGLVVEDKPTEFSWNTWSFLQSPTMFTSSKKKTKDDMNACVNNLLTVLKGHYVAAACSILGISVPDEIPKNLPNLTTHKNRMKFIAELS